MRETIFHILVIIVIGTFTVKSIVYSVNYFVDRAIDDAEDEAELICADSANFEDCLDNVLD